MPHDSLVVILAYDRYSELVSKERLRGFCVDSIDKLVRAGFSGTLDLGYVDNKQYYLMPGDGYSRGGVEHVIEYESEGLLGGFRPTARVISSSNIPFMQYDKGSLKKVAGDLDKALEAHLAPKASTHAMPSFSAVIASIGNFVRRYNHAISS